MWWKSGPRRQYIPLSTYVKRESRDAYYMRWQRRPSCSSSWRGHPRCHHQSMSAPSRQSAESELPRTSTGRFLDQHADLFFDGGGESVDCKRGSPKVTVIEVCVLLETEGRIP